MIASLLLLALSSTVLASKFTDVLRKHGIPEDANQVLLLANAAHLDYDWQNWFSTNVNNTPPDFNNYFNPDPAGSPQWTNRIFSLAAELLATQPDYHYDVCEMSFFQAFHDQLPEQWDQMMTGADRLSIVGGGVTSPDNLLPNGETFLRTFLVGTQFLGSVGLTWSGHTWFPDDFGHDSQLPVLLQALGAISTGFSRVPGSCSQGGTTANNTQAAEILLGPDGGVDFVWTASDGSSTIAHWLQGGYWQGSCLYTPTTANTYNSTEQNLLCQATIGGSELELLQGFVNTNGPAAPSPAMFVPVCMDFEMPLPSLVSIVQQWNLEKYPETGVYASVSSYSIYMELLQAWAAEHPGALASRNWHGSTPQTSFQPNPYWTGFYASRQQLKLLHSQASQLLLAAESVAFAAATAGYGNWDAELAELWAALTVTTHHDYVTGTSIDHVYNTTYEGVWGEQLAGLTHLVQSSSNLLAKIAATWAVPAGSALLYNQLSSEVTTLVWLNNQPVSVTIPPLGFVVAPIPGPVPPPPASNQLTLSNSLLTATIALDEAGWTVASLIDSATGSDVLGGPAYGLYFWDDSYGTLYRYGFEVPDCRFTALTAAVTASQYYYTESALSASIVANVTFAVATPNNGTVLNSYVYVFTLNNNEPFLRVSITGSAPPETAVFTAITFGEAIDWVAFGTTYHWEVKRPTTFGPTSPTQQLSPAFDATHDFVMPLGTVGPLAALYHESVGSWGAPPGSVLWGALMRSNAVDSPPCQDQGANGIDTATHTLNYALRVPTGLSAASTGQARAEAEAFNTPPYVLPGAGSGPAKATQFSLLSVVEGPVQVTAAKPCVWEPTALVLRLYNPTLKPATAVLALAGLTGPYTVLPMNALEELTGQPQTFSGPNVTLSCPFALTTVLVIPDSHT